MFFRSIHFYETFKFCFQSFIVPQYAIKPTWRPHFQFNVDFMLTLVYKTKLSTSSYHNTSIVPGNISIIFHNMYIDLTDQLY